MFPLLATICLLAVPAVALAQTKPAPKPAVRAAAPAGPVIVMDTVKGVIEIELYPDAAPKSVDHILRLVQKNFYNGQRVHRVVKGGLIQFGDPLSRDMTKRDSWGVNSLGSGRTVGVAEFSKKRLHVRGAVGLAHAGDATYADSQLYIILVPRPQYDGDYVVVGGVISGLDVAAKIEETDRIKRVYVKEAASK